MAVLVRLRSDRCFYADPPLRPPGSTGRPRRHGAKFNCADPTTWPVPTATLDCQDDQYGTVTVKAWTGLHPKQQRHPGHGSRGPRPIVRGTILRVQVERVPARTRPPKVLWLWWAGPGSCDLDLAWRAYVRRFDLEHTVRFCKQALGWTTRGRGIPPRPTGGPGWCWLPTPSCAWPARPPATSGCRGRCRDPSRGCRPIGCAAGFRGCCAHSAHRLPRRNPADAPRAGPRAGLLGLQSATRRSRSPPRSPRRSHPRRRRLPDRLGPPSTPSTFVDGQPGMPSRVKSQAQGLEADQRAGQMHQPQQDVGAPLVAHLEPPIAHQPRQRPLHHIPVMAQPLAGLHTTPGDPGRDPPAAQCPPAAPIVIALVAMQLGGSLARAPESATRTLDRRHRVQHGLQQHRVMGVGRRQADRQRDTAAVDQQVVLGPGLRRSVGFGPVRPPPAWRARSTSPGWPATSRVDPRGRARRAAGGATAATRRRAASRAAAASR